MLILAQLTLLCGLVAIVVAPIAFFLFAYRFAVRRDSRRAFLVTTLFITGALAGGFVVWQLIPASWPLSLGATLKATVDTETYTHQVEHYAEGVVLAMTTAGLAGGAVAAGATAFLTRGKLAA